MYQLIVKDCVTQIKGTTEIMYNVPGFYFDELLII